MGPTVFMCISNLRCFPETIKGIADRMSHIRCNDSELAFSAWPFISMSLQLRNKADPQQKTNKKMNYMACENTMNHIRVSWMKQELYKGYK